MSVVLPNLSAKNIDLEMEDLIMKEKIAKDLLKIQAVFLRPDRAFYLGQRDQEPYLL